MMGDWRTVLLGMAVSSIIATSSALAAEEFDPATVDLADVLACKIEGHHYLGFALSISDDDSAGSAKARGWVKVPTTSPLFSSYRLPTPLRAFGYTTSTLAFTGTAMLAVLDLADANALAETQGITNILDGSGRFMGERIVDETAWMDKESRFGFKNRSALQIATNPAFPGKVLIGCSYAGEVQLPK